MTWDESKHPRDPEGSSTGGQWIAAESAARKAAGLDVLEPYIKEAVKRGAESGGEAGFMYDRKTGEVIWGRGGKKVMKLTKDQLAERYNKDREIVDVHTHPPESLYPPSDNDIKAVLDDPGDNAIVEDITISENGASRYTIIPLKRIDSNHSEAGAAFVAAYYKGLEMVPSSVSSRVSTILTQHYTLLYLDKAGVIDYQFVLGPKTQKIIDTYKDMFKEFN